MHERPLRDDEYPDDDEPVYRTDRATDPVSDAVGSSAYLARYVIDECVQTFEGRVRREPERFDRFYFGATPPVLMDILPDLTASENERAKVAKHVEFKQAWCASHGRVYVVVGESDSENVQLIRELVARAIAPADEPGAPENPIVVVEEPRARPARKRGTVSRPKATA